MRLRIAGLVALCFAVGSLAFAAGAEGKMLTRWGASLKPDSVWQEYPRPQLVRSNWTNLNGQWDYSVTSKDAKSAGKWNGKILVPFAIESALSGVGRRFTPEEALWYRRSFEVKKRSGRRYLLNFEAVDYQSTVWVNGTEVGSNTGGNLPFSHDITDALESGKNEVILRVTDATDTAYQLHGKQRSTPKGIWYTPVSGIWQTVWLEEVPERYITGLKITPKIDGTVSIEIGTSGKAAQATVTASLKGKQVATAKGTTKEVTLTIPKPQLWSPDTPTLYDLKIQVGEDTVSSYVGLRETGIRRDADGYLRFTLNGKPIFHWGTLDQGWWPDGLHTPPSDEAMRFDIEFLKAAGFNTIRKHIKVEPRRYYYHCDRIGMMMWQDQVSAMADNPPWTRLRPNPATRTWPEAAHRQFMDELKLMIDTLYSHPCIVQWVPFNERWGQHQTVEVGKWTVDYDPSRQVNIASGGNFFPVGHIVDAHKYPHPGFPFDQGEGGRFKGFVKVMGEFGGHGFPVRGHLWNPDARNWGYGGLPKDKAEWIERYETSIRMLNELRGQGIAGGIYTQTTDVEGEINGLLTYDRKVTKVPAAQLAVIHRQLFQAPPKSHVILPETAEGWRFVTGKPKGNWKDVAFDDKNWKTGRAGFGTKKTPGISVRTEWATKEIWLRRAFDLKEVDTDGPLVLKLYHDEDAEVYLNGKEVARETGYVTRYKTIPLGEAALGLLKKGRNVLAIHVRQTMGGQGVDAGLYWTGTSQSAAPTAPVAPVKPAMSRKEIEAGLKSHDRALYIKEGWIRDPYIILGPDDFYYLTGTTPQPEESRDKTDPYNIGLGNTSIVGKTVQVWRSKDLVAWEYLGTPFTLKGDSRHRPPGDRLWAPELHWLGDRWALVHCPGPKANFALTDGLELKGPWTHPMGAGLGRKHDPSLFKNTDGTWHMLWANTLIAPLSKDLINFTSEPQRIDPAGIRTNALGRVKSVIGHEGATMRRIGDKYVHFGTAWSTDEGRKGSYNLYYCTADTITGPYGPRKFAGRFLGHGTPFQTRDGKWWCTAFFNANVPPLPRKGIQTRDLSGEAQTINHRGTTIVPLEVRVQDDGGIFIRAKDPDYRNPGPDEVQEF